MVERARLRAGRSRQPAGGPRLELEALRHRGQAVGLVVDHGAEGLGRFGDVARALLLPQPRARPLGGRRPWPPSPSPANSSWRARRSSPGICALRRAAVRLPASSSPGYGSAAPAPPPGTATPRRRLPPSAPP